MIRYPRENSPSYIQQIIHVIATISDYVAATLSTIYAI